MKKLTEEEVNKVIADHIEKAQAHIAAAELLAKEYEVEFSWDGPAYGMGGWFESGEWRPSSQSC